MEILTKRLLIRPWTLLDVNDMYAYASDPRVSGAAGFIVSDCIGTSLQIINQMILKNDSYAIVLRDGNIPIGSIGMFQRTIDINIDADAQCEIGYALNQKYWGNKYVPEAVIALLDYCFDVLNIELVWVSHADFNHNSKRVIEQIGFKCVPGKTTIKESHVYYCYSMSKNEWKKLNKL